MCPLNPPGFWIPGRMEVVAYNCVRGKTDAIGQACCQSKICVFPVNIQAIFPVMDCSTLFRLQAQHMVLLHVRSIDKEGPRCCADESCVCLDQATAQEMPK